jgi:MFS family permease
MRLGIVSGVLWSVGAGLTGGELIRYLALDLGAAGFSFGFILAMPALAGLLRMGTPAVIRWTGSAKRACLAAHAAASTLLLLLLPAVGQVERPSAVVSLVGLLCATHVLSAVGIAAYWTWWGDIVPRRIRGRYFGRVQIWQLIALIPTLWAFGRFTDLWLARHARSPWSTYLQGYAIPNGIGAGLLLLSLVPLALVPATRSLPRSRFDRWSSLWLPLTDRRFRRFLIFHGWFSMANGLTQAAQTIFGKLVLHLGVGDMALMGNTMRGGQIAYTGWAGPFSDRFGNRPVLVLSQWFVGLAMLFYLFASPGPAWRVWLPIGAYICWSAYAGHNVCLPNLALKLAPDEHRAAYLAAHEAVGAVAYAMASGISGFLAIRTVEYAEAVWQLHGAASYAPIFLAGLALRLAGVVFAAKIREPASRSWGDILRTWTARPSANPEPVSLAARAKE